LRLLAPKPGHGYPGGKRRVARRHGSRVPIALQGKMGGGEVLSLLIVKRYPGSHVF
jgi:hypothetical protein